MKRFLFGAVTAALVTGSTILAGPVLAADLPIKTPVFRETLCDYGRYNGWYFGGHLAGVQATQHLVDEDGYINARRVGVGSGESFSRTNDGWAGGVDLGWNWQSHCTVFGIVADGSWGSDNLNTRFFPDFVNPIASINEGINTKVNSFGTLRTKGGIVVDSAMIYVTGGLAWARVKTTLFDIESVTSGSGAGTLNSQLSFSSTKWGWTAGVGGEFGLTPNLSIFSEILYMSFPKKDSRVGEIVTTTGAYNPACTTAIGQRICSFQTGEQAVVAKIGLNYKFGAYTTPIATRY
jgi:outer membrane immunogenic protein